jgi:hypothetical protein
MIKPAAQYRAESGLRPTAYWVWRPTAAERAPVWITAHGAPGAAQSPTVSHRTRCGGSDG